MAEKCKECTFFIFTSCELLREIATFIDKKKKKKEKKGKKERKERKNWAISTTGIDLILCGSNSRIGIP